MARDPALAAMTDERIRERLGGRDRRDTGRGEEIADQLRSLGDELLAARAADVLDVAQRIARHLAGTRRRARVRELDAPAIVVARRSCAVRGGHPAPRPAARGSPWSRLAHRARRDPRPGLRDPRGGRRLRACSRRSTERGRGGGRRPPRARDRRRAGRGRHRSRRGDDRARTSRQAERAPAPTRSSCAEATLPARDPGRRRGRAPRQHRHPGGERPAASRSGPTGSASSGPSSCSWSGRPALRGRAAARLPIGGGGVRAAPGDDPAARRRRRQADPVPAARARGEPVPRRAGAPPGRQSTRRSS